MPCRTRVKLITSNRNRSASRGMYRTSLHHQAWHCIGYACASPDKSTPFDSTTRKHFRQISVYAFAYSREKNPFFQPFLFLSCANLLVWNKIDEDKRTKRFDLSHQESSYFSLVKSAGQSQYGGAKKYFFTHHFSVIVSSV